MEAAEGMEGVDRIVGKAERGRTVTYTQSVQTLISTAWEKTEIQ
jgi:hypothetical protein